MGATDMVKLERILLGNFRNDLQGVASRRMRFVPSDRCIWAHHSRSAGFVLPNGQPV